MNHKTKLSLAVLLFSTLVVPGSLAVAQEAENSDNDAVLFKIHNIVPEKDMNGKVLYCNIGATFFNRTPKDISNVTISLTWNDDVIAETIDLEERADREAKRINPSAQTSRYTTASLSSKDIKATLKLPPIKSNQQVTLKTKVDTERCFLLLGDAEVDVTNCGTAGMTSKSMASSKGCDNLFRYVSPKSAEYYQEFKEVSLEEQNANEDKILDNTQREIDNAYNAALNTIRNITNEAIAAPVASNEGNNPY